MGKIKQRYDIKFPFTENNEEGLFLDLNNSIEDKALSDLVHVILTPKRSRIRRPDFGTDLMKFIWEMNDDTLWNDIREEIKSSVSKFVENVTLNDIAILRDTNNDNKIVISLRYTLKKGNKEIQKEVNIPI